MYIIAAVQNFNICPGFSGAGLVQAIILILRFRHGASYRVYQAASICREKVDIGLVVANIFPRECPQACTLGRGRRSWGCIVPLQRSSFIAGPVSFRSQTDCGYQPDRTAYAKQNILQI